MRIVVTGAEGFLGRALAARLGADPSVELFALGRTALDLRRRSAIVETLSSIQPEVIVHAAGRTPGRPGALFADNALATANLAEAIGEARCGAGLILLGSAAQYGVSETQTPWRETDPCMPFEPYGVSKHTAETCAFAAARRWGFKVSALRLFNVVSAQPQGEQVFATFLRRAAAAAQAGPPPWRVSMGPLTTVRDFVDLDDVLAATERVIGRDAWGEAINVCSGIGRTARVLLDAVAAQTGALVIEEDPPTQLPELPWSVGDPGRCEALLGLRPSTDLAPVTRRAAAWLMTMAKDGESQGHDSQELGRCSI